MHKDVRRLSIDRLLRLHNLVGMLQKGVRPHVINQEFRELVEKKSQAIPKIWGDV